MTFSESKYAILGISHPTIFQASKTSTKFQATWALLMELTGKKKNKRKETEQLELRKAWDLNPFFPNIKSSLIFNGAFFLTSSGFEIEFMR